MSTTPPALDLKSVAALMTGVANLEHQDLGLELDRKFLEQAAFVGLGIFRLVVMGEIKKGKSSFINALCGIDKMVPVHSDIATSTIFKIRHGAELKYTVYFQEVEGEPQRKAVIGGDEINDYGTETGNPGNIKQVDFIAVEAPSPLLASGVMIVDTPGVGGLFKEHRDITFRHAPRADGVFFITDSVESPIGAEEVAFLKELRRITAKIYFIQTKAEKVGEAAAQARMKNNLTILTEQVGFEERELVYFIVSSALKRRADRDRDMTDLQDSGFVPLMRYLNVELKARLDRSIGAVALERTRAKLQAILPEIAWRRKVLEATSAEKRSELEKDLNDLNDRLRQWQTQELPQLKREFNQVLGEAVQQAQEHLNLCLRPGGSIADEAAGRLDNMSSAAEIYESAGTLFNDARAAASFALIDSCHGLEARLKQLVQMLEDKVRGQVADYFETQPAGDRVKAEAVDDLDLSSTRAITSLQRKAHEGSFLEAARGSFVAATSTVSLGALVIGVASVLFPVVGTVVAAAGWGLVASTAGAAGALAAHRSRKAREAEAARRDVRGELNSEMGHLHAQAMGRLARLQSSLGSQAGEALEGIAAAVNRTLEQRKKVLDQRARDTAEELRAQGQAQQHLEERAGKIIAQLNALATLVAA